MELPDDKDIPQEWKDAIWRFTGALDDMYMDGALQHEQYNAAAMTAGLFTGWAIASNYTLIPPPELIDSHVEV